MMTNFPNYFICEFTRPVCSLFNFLPWLKASFQVYFIWLRPTQLDRESLSNKYDKPQFILFWCAIYISLELVITDRACHFFVQYGSNVSECLMSMGVPSETSAGSYFCFSVGAETLVSRCRGCSLATHIRSQETWSFHRPPTIQVLYDIEPHLSGIYRARGIIDHFEWTNLWAVNAHGWKNL